MYLLKLEFSYYSLYNRVQKCFGNRFHAPPLSVRPPPPNNVDFFDRTNFWNTEIVIFNIDMGEGRITAYLSQRNIENYAFSKHFCTRLSEFEKWNMLTLHSYNFSK